MYQVKWRGLFSGKLSALWSIIIVSCLLLWQFHWMSAVSPQSVCLYIPDDTPLFASIRETPWTFSPTHTQLQCVCVCVCVLANMPWVCLLLLRFNLCHPAAVETAPVDALYCFPPVFSPLSPQNLPQFVCLVKQNLFSLQLIAFYSIATCQTNSFKLSTPLAQEFSATQHNTRSPLLFGQYRQPCSMNFLAPLSCCWKSKKRGERPGGSGSKINKSLFSVKPAVSVHLTKNKINHLYSKIRWHFHS